MQALDALREPLPDIHVRKTVYSQTTSPSGPTVYGNCQAEQRSLPFGACADRAVCIKWPPSLSIGLEGSDVGPADIIIADEKQLPQAVDLYNVIFRPRRDVAYFQRRFTGRHNILTLLAQVNDRPVGFWIGFELKPGMFYHWLGAVAPAFRRQGIARQLHEAQQAWARDHEYEHIRCEALNHQ